MQCTAGHVLRTGISGSSCSPDEGLLGGLKLSNFDVFKRLSVLLLPHVRTDFSQVFLLHHVTSTVPSTSTLVHFAAAFHSENHRFEHGATTD